MIFLICAALFIIPFVIGVAALLKKEGDYFEESIEDFPNAGIGVILVMVSVLCFVSLVVVGIVELI